MSYQKYTKEVKNWNNIMGNGPSKNHQETVVKLKRQIKFVVEETLEMQEAADEDDIIEILDALQDLRFVSDQVAVYLESLGIDLEGSWNEVVRSNNSKFTDDPFVITSSQRSFTNVGIPTDIEQTFDSEGKIVYIIKRRKDGKVLKPLCFTQPNLKPFVPEEFH